MSKATTHVTEVTLEKYPVMKTLYYIRDEATGQLCQALKLTKNTKAKEGATVYSVLTSTQNVHKFVMKTEAVEVDRNKLKELEKRAKEVFKLYMASDISKAKFDEAMAEIEQLKTEA